MSLTAVLDAPREADMASDLPQRPKQDKAKKAKKVAATDRVKSAGDKLDPRFEAARKRVEREEARRAKAEAARKAKADAEEQANNAAPETKAPKKGFSFNQTAQRDAS